MNIVRFFTGCSLKDALLSPANRVAHGIIDKKKRRTAGRHTNKSDSLLASFRMAPRSEVLLKKRFYATTRIYQ